MKSPNAALRNKFGMSQDLYAHWIGMTRSLLALVESDKNSKPSDATMKEHGIRMTWLAFEKNYSADPQKMEPGDKIIFFLNLKLILDDENFKRFNFRSGI